MPISLLINMHIFFTYLYAYTFINMPFFLHIYMPTYLYQYAFFFTYLYAYISICTYVPVLTLRYNRIEKCADTI